MHIVNGLQIDDQKYYVYDARINDATKASFVRNDKRCHNSFYNES